MTGTNDPLSADSTALADDAAGGDAVPDVAADVLDDVADAGAAADPIVCAAVSARKPAAMAIEAVFR